MGLHQVIKIFKICCIAFLFLLCLVPLSCYRTQRSSCMIVLASTEVCLKARSMFLICKAQELKYVILRVFEEFVGGFCHKVVTTSFLKSMCVMFFTVWLRQDFGCTKLSSTTLEIFSLKLDAECLKSKNLTIDMFSRVSSSV